MAVPLSDLLLITISIPPREIERLLDALAKLPYHINPDLKYREWLTDVQFPAYRSWLTDLQQMLNREGFQCALLRDAPALAAVPAY
jgi:hypothetical protein